MHSFYILGQIFDKKNCILSEAPKTFRKDAWRIPKGVEMGDRHPSEVVIKMFDEHRGIAVPDLVSNTLSYCIASKRLKEFLVAQSGARIECLPISIANHKDRIVPGEHFILNILDHHDCIDQEKSDVDRNDPDPNMLSGLHRLYIHPEKVPQEAKLFRLKPLPEAILIREDLRIALETVGFTGIRFVAMGERYDIYG